MYVPDGVHGAPRDLHTGTQSQVWFGTDSPDTGVDRPRKGRVSHHLGHGRQESEVYVPMACRDGVKPRTLPAEKGEDVATPPVSVRLAFLIRRQSIK